MGDGERKWHVRQPSGLKGRVGRAYLVIFTGIVAGTDVKFLKFA